MDRRSRIAKLAAWICLLAIVAVAAADSIGFALPPPVESSLGLPSTFFLPLGCLVVRPQGPDALGSDAGRAPPLS